MCSGVRDPGRSKAEQWGIQGPASCTTPELRPRDHGALERPLRPAARARRAWGLWGAPARPRAPRSIPARAIGRADCRGAIVTDPYSAMSDLHDHQSRPRRPLTRADVMTASEVSDLLGVPKSTVYELARRGELPCARLGRTVRFVRSEIEARLLGF